MLPEKAFSFFLGLFVIILVWFVVPILLIYFNDFLKLPIIVTPLSLAFGIICSVFGLSAALYLVIKHLQTGRVTPIAIESPRKLIVHGLYKYSRNPMYLAILLAFLGYFLISGRFLLLLYFLLAIPAIHLFVVYKEEPQLKEKFGADYLDYLKKVPRWLPKIDKL